METRNIPREKSWDSTLALMREGYTFIKSRCEAHHSDIFKSRIMGQRTIFMTGEEASALFYDNKYFIRKRATPKRVQNTLFGQKGVQTLDDEAHRKRKEMFMSLMSAERLKLLADITREKLREAAFRWEKTDKILMLDAAQEVMCRVACEWAGVPVQDGDVPKRSKEFAEMVDAFGGIGERHRKGKKARKSSEVWIRRVITQIRDGKIKVTPNTAAFVFALQLENGELLDVKVAAVELINILRPIVAIGNYIAFAALALHTYPQYKKRIQSGDNRYAEWFTQEVRRFYPFTPFVGARVRESFEWKGYSFPKKTLVLLDVYGTDHDARTWEQPDVFWPDRFRNWRQSPHDFIPQGGGDHHSGHRCAGEWVIIEALKVAVKFLAQNMQYEVPEQDLSIDLSRMPAIPASHFEIQKVKIRQRVAQPV
jgi:fatty-acid peroxygenase